MAVPIRVAVVARQQVEHELIKEGVCCARQGDKEAEEVVVLAGRVFHDEDVDVFDDRDGRHDDDELREDGVLDDDVDEAKGLIERPEQAFNILSKFNLSSCYCLKT